MRAFAGRRRPTVILCLATTLLTPAATAAENWPRASTPAPDASLQARARSSVMSATIERARAWREASGAGVEARGQFAAAVAAGVRSVVARHRITVGRRRPAKALIQTI